LTFYTSTVKYGKAEEFILMCRFFKNKEQRADQAKLRAWIHSKSDSKFATGDIQE
jgi:hypothetical protein